MIGAPSVSGDDYPLAGLLTRTVHPEGVLAVERSLPIPSERTEPDVLAGLVVELVPVVAPAPLGGPNVDPARRLVDGAGVNPE